MVTDWLFFFFAALTVIAGFLVALSRSPVNAAMNMILSFIGMAGLFVLLETFFLAVLQVLVYAGAIVVLFLFIIMLIDPAKLPRPRMLPTFGSAIVAAGLTVGWFVVLQADTLVLPERVPAESFAGGQAPAATARVFGEVLFSQYLLPFEVAGVLLLIAMLGVIVISKNYRPATTRKEGGSV
ncbi:MAG: NADH-quinone oxidoreductase subunit J [Verrucomicrobiota bacterium JB022]|nr:NADH-quinone oxidoreductase subunit J [Verrucomicrobiota bacterium JB022]